MFGEFEAQWATGTGPRTGGASPVVAAIGSIVVPFWDYLIESKI